MSYSFSDKEELNSKYFIGKGQIPNNQSFIYNYIILQKINGIYMYTIDKNNDSNFINSAINWMNENNKQYCYVEETL